MDTDILFQIAAVGILVAILNLILTKSDRSEHALMVTIGGLIIVLAIIVNAVADLFDTIKSVFGL